MIITNQAGCLSEFGGTVRVKGRSNTWERSKWGCHEQGDTQGFDSFFHIVKVQTGRNKPKPEKIDFHIIAAVVIVAAIVAIITEKVELSH